MYKVIYLIDIFIAVFLLLISPFTANYSFPLHIPVAYAGTHTNFPCNKIGIDTRTNGETPICPNPQQINKTMTSYSSTTTIHSVDGNRHTFTYRAYTNDCAHSNGIPCSDNNTLDRKSTRLNSSHAN